MFGLSEGIFECCNPLSAGEPEFLAQEQHISSRAATNLVSSANGALKLYFQSWRSDRHDHVRACVVVHPGELEHSSWYNGLAVRFASIGCSSFVLDAQGFGQSDGARGYFESFDDIVADYVEFCKLKWTEVANEQARNPRAPLPGFVLVGKGIGALVVVRALLELQPIAAQWGVAPVAVFISPAFQFASFIGDQSNVSCGLNSGQCARQPAAQCARLPASVGFNPPGVGDGPHQKLEHTSRWFPKMIVTEPIDPDIVSRDPQTVDRLNRDALCWRQGYRARVLAEIVSEQSRLTEIIAGCPEVFECVPALLLHGGGDKLFSVGGSHGVHSLWCDAASRTRVYPRLKIYDGAYHQLLQEPNKDEVLNDILLFVTSKLGTL
eukprot:TRINITY_DN19654_c0_g1_i1.p1 TRINITY_DN19654_c0_g1~~TRINITY_DN19654_c0_g1_i1.p1  ORF type:complete len:379 (-),score=67.12 TRINITY_DN19654_c0_g1_i1:74-1210(-)